ncbi:hypothetical protein HMPREF9413_5935 [Paenibacillus sp. HGF7]|nr:hypothetical protein HMPREF9413_5935 [Paenibacillus sp. HGF7]EPD88871.1 hypothetical protein HMPREF1207_01822 [Paenibacillus sp. HGH0039]
MNEQSNGMILNRKRNAGPAVERTEDITSYQESDKNPQLEAVTQLTTNDTLASQFPEWDLKPPAALIRRRGSKLL